MSCLVCVCLTSPGAHAEFLSSVSSQCFLHLRTVRHYLDLLLESCLAFCQLVHSDLAAPATATATATGGRGSRAPEHATAHGRGGSGAHWCRGRLGPPA